MKHTKSLGRFTLHPLVAALLLLPLAGCNSGGDDNNAGINTKPAGVGTITVKTYDGNTDDLLTAGLGKTGLAGAAPTIANPASPTAAELRKLTIYNNYRALIDVSATGGYGELYGPNVNAAGVKTTGEGKIGGEEFLAYVDDGTGKQNVTLMVQIPSNFNVSTPCIVSATSSGSRGIYGAIGTAGEWGLKKGCAVAYADKGTGMGFHDLANDTVHLIDGLRTTRTAAGNASHFSADLGTTSLADFNRDFPNRIAVKQAHSKQNPQKDWGKNTLAAVEMAFFLLNEKFGTPTSTGRLADFAIPGKTIVIASSVSNGGGSALAAAEQDTKGLISGVTVGEPVVQNALPANLTIRQGSTTFNVVGKPLHDYTTFANVYQACAALAPAASGANAASASVNVDRGTARCQSLADKGLVTGATTTEQATDALNKLIAYGWLPEANALHDSHYAFATPPVAVMYINSYGRFGVNENVCNFSYAFTDAAGAVTAPVVNSLLASFANGNGIPGTIGINLINNSSTTAVKLDALSTSPSTSRTDFNLDGALCLRQLATGKAVSGTALAGGADLTGAAKTQADRVAAGARELLLNGNLQGKPTIIVHGRSDALIPVNHSSRPYFALNQTVEGANSKLRYIEVTNGQHFDAFINSFPGYRTRYIPLHVYLVRGLDAMYDHLATGKALPGSQVVRTTPRSSDVLITAASMPAIVATPATADAITFTSNTLNIPN